MANTRANKTRTFVIPKGFISVFFDKLEDSGLDYELTEVNQEGDLRLEVEYSPSEREEMMNLVELEDEFYDEEDGKEEENEEED